MNKINSKCCLLLFVLLASPSIAAAQFSLGTKCNDVVDVSIEVLSVQGCTVNLRGKFFLLSPELPTFSWFVNGVLVDQVKTGSTQNLFSYTAPSPGGSVDIELVVDVGNCSGSKTLENIKLVCPFIQIDPTPVGCPNNKFSIIAGFPTIDCTDVQAIWQIPTNSTVEEIDWRYSIGPFSNVFIGTTTGNAGGTHVQSFSLLPNPSGASWDGFVLVVKAVPVLANGEMCDEVVVTQTLTCDNFGLPSLFAPDRTADRAPDRQMDSPFWTQRIFQGVAEMFDRYFPSHGNGEIGKSS